MFNQFLRAVSLIALAAVLVSLPNTLIASEMTTDKAAKGVQVELFELRSDAVDAMVPMSILLPPEFDREAETQLPLLIGCMAGVVTDTS